jgi:mono/diheme cytochrome c family protein
MTENCTCHPRPLVPGLSLLFIALLAILPAGCWGTPQGNAPDGGRWFVLNRCNGCHGVGGHGARGPAIAGINLSFHSFLHKLRHPASEVMPTFEPERLSDQDAADIYLWLQTQQQ